MSFAVCCACAERQNVPAGDELDSADSAHPADAGTSAMPHASDKELATAWEAPAPAPEKPAEPPQEDQATAARTVSAQAEAETRAKLKELLVGGRRSLGARKLDDAQTISEGAVELASSLAPQDQQQAAELAAKVALARADVPASIKAVEKWLLSCGPDKVEGCRSQALGALGKVAKLKGASGVAEKLKALRDADSCVTQATAKKSGAGCLDSAVATYARSKDNLMLARVLWAKTTIALGDPKRSGEVEGLLKRTEKECTELRCVGVRSKALKTTATLAQRAGDFEVAATATLKELRLSAALLPADRRPYARSAEVESICASYEAKAGAGACRKLEKKVNGGWLFRDFSLGKAASALDPEQVKRVNEHFNCLLQECLTLEAERLTPPDQVEYDVLWDVSNDGRVSEVHLGRKDQEGGPMLQCLKRQFSQWRYPKYQGELQHVAQRFTVSAHERRTR